MNTCSSLSQLGWQKPPWCVLKTLRCSIQVAGWWDRYSTHRKSSRSSPCLLTIVSRYDSFHSLPHLSLGLYIYSICELRRNRHNLESQLQQEPLKDNRKYSSNWQPTAQGICIRLDSYLLLLLMYRKIQVTTSRGRKNICFQGTITETHSIVLLAFLIKRNYKQFPI